MPIKILMPALSPTMTEGTLAKWLKNEGDMIKPGDVIAEIETDKATMEVESVDEGILTKILVPGNSFGVKVNSIIGVMKEEGDSDSEIEEIIESLNKNDTKSQNKSNNTDENQKNADNEKISNQNEAKLGDTCNKTTQHPTKEKVFVSPLAKRIAEQNSVDIKQIAGSGPHGRIIKSDIIEFIENPKPQEQIIKSNQITRELKSDSRIPLTTMRRVIAERLLESKQNIPHFYLSNDFEISDLLTARNIINQQAPLNFEKQPLYKISINDMVIKATAVAMQAVPEVNAAWGGDFIMSYGEINIAIAVALDDGLITPIIKNADQKTLSQISNEVKELVKKAKNNLLRPEEFQGGSLSISNLGMYGIQQFSAIVNPPQSCILAVGAVVESPVVKNGGLVVGNTMNVTISCDHRVIDGAIAARFMQALGKCLNNPILMLA